jgi:hypothetical protein
LSKKDRRSLQLRILQGSLRGVDKGIDGNLRPGIERPDATRRRSIFPLDAGGHLSAGKASCRASGARSHLGISGVEPPLD